MLDVCLYLVLHPTGQSKGYVPFSQSQLDSEDIGVHQGLTQSSISERSFPDIPGLSLELSLKAWLYWLVLEPQDGSTGQMKMAAAGGQNCHRELTVPLCCSFTRFSLWHLHCLFLSQKRTGRTVILIWRLIWRSTMAHGFLRCLCFLGQNTARSSSCLFGGVQQDF